MIEVGKVAARMAGLTAAAACVLALCGCDRFEPSAASRPAYPPPPGRFAGGGGRWSVVPAAAPSGGVWRMDTRTGALSYCTADAGGVKCSVPDVPAPEAVRAPDASADDLSAPAASDVPDQPRRRSKQQDR
jgi:hypothetical protein